MFMSASIDVKFHYWPKVQQDIIFKPQKLSKCTCASWSKDNAYLAYLTEKTRPEVFAVRDLKNIKLVHTISAISDVTCMCFQRSAKRCIATGSQNGQVVLYDTRNKQINKLFGNAPSAVRYIDFNAGDENIGVACQNGSVVLYDVSGGHVSGNYVISENEEPTSLRFHPHQPNILAASSREGTVMMWDTTTANKTFFAQTHTSAVTGIAFGKENNDILVSIGDDCKFCIHDLSMRECIFRSSVQQPLSAVDISPDGITITIGSQDGTIYLYDVRHFLMPKTSWKAHPTRITKILYQNLMKDHCPFMDMSSSESVSQSQPTEIQSADTSKIIEGDLTTSSKFSCHTRRTTTERHPVDNEYLKNVKTEIISSIQKDTQDASNQLKIHMNNLQSFIENEFHKMDVQMEDKWELVNLASLNLTKDNEDATYAHSITSSHVEEHPLVLD